MLTIVRINDGCLNREGGTDTVAETKRALKRFYPIERITVLPFCHICLLMLSYVSLKH